MKGFILISFNKQYEVDINLSNLETELKKRNLLYIKKAVDCRVYDYNIGYQIADSINTNYLNSNHFFSGDIYGMLGDQNIKLLNDQESLSLINESELQNGYIAFEGNACIASIFEEKITFQNDLEGSRKIFYYKNDNVFVLTTYLPLLFVTLLRDWKIRKNAVISFICSRETKWPLTFVEDVFVLPPLSRAELTRNGINITSKTFSEFYNLKKVNNKNLRSQLYDQYKIIAQRKSNANIAVTLSGGYDSNCLTKLYTDIYKQDFTSISVGYICNRKKDYNIYDETIYAEKITKKLKIPFKRYLIERNEFFKSLNEFIEAIDQPAHDPSSNFIMNKYLKNDGFNLVVNGMGGDANFSYKRNLNWGTKIYKYTKSLGGTHIPEYIGKYFDYKGPFIYFRPYLNHEQFYSFHDLFERSQLFNSDTCAYVTYESQKLIDKEREYRREYYDNLYKKSKTKQELFYSLSLTCSPAEYHALLTADRNNIEILMPFINTKATLLMMNGSHYNKVNNREFEISIFGGIDKNLLAKRKSGFSIPYSEWMQSHANKIFEYYLDENYFSKEDFDLLSFKKRYSSDEHFRNSTSANIIVWKLMVLKEYTKRNHLNL